MSPTNEAPWRLIVSPARRGAANMALDEAILEQACAGEAPPTLRLYAWQPPCLSLGYAQPAADVDRERLAALGWGLVRRPTGGRAILHTDELTYAIIAPAGHPDLRGGVLESYRRLSGGLVAALRRLGLAVDPPQVEPLAAGERSNPVCFEAPSAYEITVSGYKLIGSAQVRRRGGILQHGTLPLRGDLRRICLALRYPDDAARAQARRRVLERAATLERLLGHSVSWDQAAEALQHGFHEALGWQYEMGELLESEAARALELEHTRFGGTGWTDRV